MADRDPADFPGNPNPPAKAPEPAKAPPAAPAPKTSAGTGALPPAVTKESEGDASPLASSSSSSPKTYSVAENDHGTHDVFLPTDDFPQQVGSTTLGKDDAEPILKASGAIYDEKLGVWRNVPEQTVKLLQQGPASLTSDIKEQLGVGLADFHRASMGLALAQGQITAEDFRQRTRPDLVKMQLERAPGAAWKDMGDAISDFVQLQHEGKTGEAFKGLAHDALSDVKALPRMTVAEAAKALPSLNSLATYTAGGALVGGGLAALAGPEAIPLGVKGGAIAGSFLSLYNQELGARMATLADRGLEDHDIKKQAPVEAVKAAVGAGVYMYGLDAMAAPFKGTLLRGLAESGEAAKTMASWAHNYGVNAGIKMPAVGVIHQAVSDLLDNMTAWVEGHPEQVISPEKFSDRAIEAGAGMARLGAIMGVPGAVLEGGSAVLDRRAEARLSAQTDARLAEFESRGQASTAPSPSPSGESATASNGRMPEPSAQMASTGPSQETPQAPAENRARPAPDLSSPLPDSIKEHPAFVKALEGAKEHLPEGVDLTDRKAVIDEYNRAAQEAHDYGNEAMAKMLKVDPETGKKSIADLTPDEKNQISAQMDYLAMRMAGLRELALFARDPEAKAAYEDWRANGGEGEPARVPVDPYDESRGLVPPEKLAAAAEADKKLETTLDDKKAEPRQVIEAVRDAQDKTDERVQKATVKARGEQAKADLDALQQRIREVARTRDRMQKNGMAHRAIDLQLNKLIDQAVAKQKEIELIGNREPGELEVSKNAPLRMKPATLEDVVDAGFKEGLKAGGKQSQSRARELYQIAKDNGLTPSDVRKLIGNKAVGAMGDAAYRNFLDGFERETGAEKMAREWLETAKPSSPFNTGGRLRGLAEDVRAGRVPPDIVDALKKVVPMVRDPETGETISASHPDFPRAFNLETFLETHEPERTPGFKEEVAKLVERKQARAELASVVRERQIENERYVRQLNGMPSFRKMTTEQLKSYADILRSYEKNDVAFSPKRIEALKGTELEGARTEGEARAKLKQLTGLPLEDLKNVQVSARARALPEPAARAWNPALGAIFDSTQEKILKGKRLAEIVSDRNQTLAADAIREMRSGMGAGERIADALAPQQRRVMQYLEASDPAQIAALSEQMGPKELKWADWAKAWLGTAYSALERKGMVSRFVDAYAPHVNKSTPEVLRDLLSGQRGLKESLGDLLPRTSDELSDFVDKDGNVLGFNKFFKQSVFRTGALDPSRNVVTSLDRYIHDFYSKMALDEAVPYVKTMVDVMESKDPESKEFGSSLAAFTKRYLNNKKGINDSFGAAGDLAAPALRAAEAAASIHYIAANYALQAVKGLVAVPTAEFMAIDNPVDFARARGLRWTEKGQTFLDNMGYATGKPVLDQLKEPGRDVGDYAKAALYGGFQRAHQRALGNILLAAATPEELEAGRMSDARVNEVFQKAGRWINIEGQDSIFGSHTVGQSLEQFKKWLIPPTLSIAEDAHALYRQIVSGGKEKMTPEQVHEALKLGALGAAAAATTSIVSKDMEDDTFEGQVIHYLRRAVGSMWHGMDPVVWMTAAGPGYVAKLALDLHMLGTMERYKRGEHEGDLKGWAALKRDLTPRMMKDAEKAAKRLRGED